MTLADNFTNIVSPLSNKLAIRSKTTTPVASYVPAGRPEFPEELSPTGKKIFKELCQLLQERRTLTRGDGDLLILYVQTRARYMRAIARVESEGEIVTRQKAGKGEEVYTVEEENPWLLVAERAMKSMLSILDRVGLTPGSRDNVKVTRGGGGPHTQDDPDLVEYHISMTKNHVVATSKE
jgi:P27 family predicted phage terminase small subunit